MTNNLIPADYATWLTALKEQIRTSRIKASLAVNHELVMLYWRIGKQIVHRAGAQLPWKHNCTILDQVKDRETREWYIKKTIENGWSRSVLEMQIERIFQPFCPPTV